MKLTFYYLIPAFFSLGFLLSSCYTVKEQSVLSSKRVSSDAERLPGDYYTYKELERPSFESPYSNLEIYKSGRYKYAATQEIEQSKKLEPGAVIMGGIGASALSGWLFVSQAETTQQIKSTSGLFWAGAILGGISWWALAKSLPKNKTVKVIRPGFDYEFKNEQLLSNTEIHVFEKQQVKSIKTDKNGLLKFSPSIDFKLDYSKTNEAFNFIFKKDQTLFSDRLLLLPSDWMLRYAKITSTKVPVMEKLSEKPISYVREGMLYKVLMENDEWINIMMGSKEGWIESNKAELFYATQIKTDLSDAIKNYVIDEMQKWLIQGEFELPENYLKRIAKKDEQLLVFTNQAMDVFQKEYISFFDWKKSTISRYDPNGQTFKVQIPELEEIVISVPIEKARGFKENWDANVFKNQEFTLVDGIWKLVALEIEDPQQNFTTRFDSNIANNYDPTNQFAFDLSDFKIEIPDVSIKQDIGTQNSDNELDNYSIKTDLPQTKMSQPDAIAVVIGNAYYQKTAPVNFAINDAQLMKLYLTNVLGFKEGNVIFVMNATKAEFEGLFGSENNYKGKLFNYIKPDVSDVFIFYSGHGAPNPETRDAYFIPTDCDPDYVELQGYALKTFYSNLAKLPAKSTTVVLDACFSGAGVIKNISSVRIKPKDTEEDIKNSAIFSSSNGTQVSSWYHQKKQGIFTYFFLKAIHDHQNADINKDNDLTFNEIYDYISNKTNGIPYYARRLNAVEQTPVLKGSNVERMLVRFE